MINQKAEVIAVIDGMAGSCGKGKIIGYVAQKENIHAAITNAMPNSGHVYVDKLLKRTFRHIPVSSVNKSTKLFIGAGSAIDLEVLEKEYEDNKDIIGDREIIVHPLVPLIHSRHKDIEKQAIRSGSTFTGAGACVAEKIMRNDKVEFFKYYKNIKANNNYINEVQDVLESGGKVLLEGSQGCDLDINYGIDYPHVTSRQCSVSQMLADSGISPFFLKRVIMAIRPFPIRISNETDIGIEINSGSYGISDELTWDDINAFSGAIKNGKDYSEKTTVTKKTRRVFMPNIKRKDK